MVEKYVAQKTSKIRWRGYVGIEKTVEREETVAEKGKCY